MRRYKVVAGSRSGHCCFDWSVVDLERPVKFGPDHYRDPITDEPQYEAVCECFYKHDADKIGRALNGYPKGEEP